jgi:hypothetical protein
MLKGRFSYLIEINPTTFDLTTSSFFDDQESKGGSLHKNG